MKEDNRCNGLEHVPACSTWPPPWLTSAPAPPAPAPPPRVAAEEERHDPPPQPSAAAAELPDRLPFSFPADAVIVIADADGYTDRQMKGEPHMWTWINGPTWFYVKDYPIPNWRKGTP